MIEPWLKLDGGKLCSPGSACLPGDNTLPYALLSGLLQTSRAEGAGGGCCSQAVALKLSSGGGGAALEGGRGSGRDALSPIWGRGLTAGRLQGGQAGTQSPGGATQAA